MDLDDVVEQDQLERVQRVDRFPRVLGEDEHEQGEVPHVLGVGLVAVLGGHVRLPVHRLGLVELEEELELAAQAVIHWPATPAPRSPPPRRLPPS